MTKKKYSFDEVTLSLKNSLDPGPEAGAIVRHLQLQLLRVVLVMLVQGVLVGLPGGVAKGLREPLPALSKCSVY